MSEIDPTKPKVVHKGEATDLPSVLAEDAARVSSKDENVIPIVEETMRVDKRVVDKGTVRVATEVDEVTEEVDVELRQQTAKLERVAVDRVVDTPPEPRLDGDTIVVPIIEERAVVTKQLVVVEEVRIKLDEITKHEVSALPLRKERVTIDRIPTEDDAGATTAPLAPGGDAPARPNDQL